MADLGGDELGRLLEDTRRALGALRSGDSRGDSELAEPVRGEGSAADGKITASVVSGGRVEKLAVNPRLMRLGAEELCAQIVVAVNAAMDDLRSKAVEASPSVGDPAALAGMLENLQAESVQQMSRFSAGIAETVAKIAASSEGAARGR